MGHNEISPSHEILSQRGDRQSRSSSPSGDRKRAWPHGRGHGFTASDGGDEWVDVRQSSNFDKEKQYEELAKPSLWESITPSTRGDEEQHDDLATPSMWNSSGFGGRQYGYGDRQSWQDGLPWQGYPPSPWYGDYRDHHGGQSSYGQEARQRDESEANDTESPHSDAQSKHGRDTSSEHLLELPRNIPWCRERYRCELLAGKTMPCSTPIDDGCTADTVVMFLRDCEIDVTPTQLEDALGPREEGEGFSLDAIPLALKKLGLENPSYEYTRDIQDSIDKLQERLGKGEYPIFAALDYKLTEEEQERLPWVDPEGCHAILLDYIQTNEAGEPIYFWIRDNFDQEGPYKITTENWIKAWQTHAVVAPVNETSSDSEESTRHGRELTLHSEESSSDSEESTPYDGKSTWYQHQDQLPTHIMESWDSLSDCAKRECIAYHKNKSKNISSSKKRQYALFSQYMDYIIRL